MRKISIINQKGGVGKTTTTLNLSAALISKGKRVVMLDLDPQAGLTVSCGMDPDALTQSIYTALIEGVSLKEIMQEISERLYIIPSNVNLSAAEIELLNQGRTLAGKLAELRGAFDFAIIDTPPSLNWLTINALIAADSVIVPVQTEYLTMRALRTLFDTIERVQRGQNKSLKVLGVLPTMFDGRTLHAQEILETMRAELKGKVKVFEPIPRTIRIAESALAGKSIYDYWPESRAAAAFSDLAKELLK